MSRKDLIRLVERLPEESVEPIVNLLEAVLKLKSETPEPDNDWRLLRGMCAGGESMTKALEEEHARERKREAKKAGR